MKASEIRQLKWQLAATAALFGGCAVLAVIIIISRSFFESYLVEEYPTQHSDLNGTEQSVWRQAENGDVDQADVNKMQPEGWDRLYDVWMNAEQPNAQIAQALSQAATTTFLERAERTLVCGSHEQRLLAIAFLEMSRQADAIARLSFAHSWAKRRGLGELTTAIESALERIQRDRSPNNLETEVSAALRRNDQVPGSVCMVNANAVRCGKGHYLSILSGR